MLCVWEILKETERAQERAQERERERERDKTEYKPSYKPRVKKEWNKFSLIKSFIVLQKSKSYLTRNKDIMTNNLHYNCPLIWFPRTGILIVPLKLRYNKRTKEKQTKTINGTHCNTFSCEADPIDDVWDRALQLSSVTDDSQLSPWSYMQIYGTNPQRSPRMNGSLNLNAAQKKSRLEGNSGQGCFAYAYLYWLSERGCAVGFK